MIMTMTTRAPLPCAFTGRVVSVAALAFGAGAGLDVIAGCGAPAGKVAPTIVDVNVAPPPPPAPATEASASPEKENPSTTAVVLSGKMLPEAPALTSGLPSERNSAAIRRGFRLHAGSFRHCYEDELRTDSTLAGAIVLAFTVEAQGAVTSATLARSDPKLDVVGACIAQGFAKLSFPPPQGGALGGTLSIALDSTTARPTGRRGSPFSP